MQISEVDFAREQADIRRVRFTVFVDEQKVPRELEMDDRAAFRRHASQLGAAYGRATSGLRARYEQLGLAARNALMSVPPPAQAQLDNQRSPPPVHSEVHTQLELGQSRERQDVGLGQRSTRDGEPIDDVVLRERQLPQPVAADLDCESDLLFADELCSGGTSAERQRAVAAETGGNLRAVTARLLEETGAASPFG